jgi:hypothetical protein
LGKLLADRVERAVQLRKNDRRLPSIIKRIFRRIHEGKGFVGSVLGVAEHAKQSRYAKQVIDLHAAPTEKLRPL